MKIVFATHFPKELNSPKGGVEAVCVTLARALAELDDIELHVVTLDHQCKDVSINPLEMMTVHRIPTGRGKVIVNATGRWRKKVTRHILSLKPDVVHAHDTYGIMVRGLPLPRIFTIHGFIHGDTLVSGENFAWLRSKIWWLIEKSSWADHPHIISISPYVRERLTGIAKGVIHDIENPVSDTFFDAERKERIGTIFSAGVISRRKNTLSLIRSLMPLYRKGCYVELRLAGEFIDQEYKKEIMNFLHQNNIEKRVKMLGRLSSGEIKKELSSASVFALVSVEENSPMGIEEAMAVGVPVVTSNRCGMPYMVRHGETGFLVDPLNQDDISRRLEELLNDDNLRQKMGNNAKIFAREWFHPKRIAKKTREVYFEAVRSFMGNEA